MPNPRHCLILLVPLIAALVLRTAAITQHSQAPASWPEDDALFRVDGWTIDRSHVDASATDDSRLALLQRTYLSARGDRAEFVLWTVPQPEGRQLFRKGPDRDFLGAGYETEPAPGDLVGALPGAGAIIARQGQSSWLLAYMYGERRGALGSGPLAWGYAELDALLDRPNHYFLARVGVPFNASAALPADSVQQLARALFPRLTDWYARAAA